ncbi:iron-sulfur cluster assembly protein [Paenibacillus sp. RC67]|uniref:metal-sulfur cluster assembly factor n=1 Tax=Paenibacillus sp. RC67 TaxID=3039392 RepID=UPI0024AE1B8E|nr:iron-sulfur cluster assembly protein [Paenibacillus sp. RC67]
MNTEDRIMSALEEVIDPEIGVNVVDLGLIYGITVDDKGSAIIRMTLTVPECPLADDIVADVKQAASKVNGIQHVEVQLVWEPRWTPALMNDQAREEIRARQSLV